MENSSVSLTSEYCKLLSCMHARSLLKFRVVIIFTGTSLTAVPIYCSFTMDLLDLLAHWSDLVYLLVLDYCYCSD